MREYYLTITDHESKEWLVKEYKNGGLVTTDKKEFAFKFTKSEAEKLKTAIPGEWKPTLKNTKAI